MMRSLLFVCLALASFTTVFGTDTCNQDVNLCPKHPGVSRLSTTARPSDFANNFFVSTALLRLGVFGTGSLNANTRTLGTVGLRFLQAGVAENDATSPGCLCEGFGATGVWAGVTVAGYAGRSSGTNKITYDPISGDDTTKTIVTNARISDGSARVLGVKHEFFPSPKTNYAFEVRITLTNNHPTEPITTLKYSRYMDWDIYPTTFSECVDIDIGNAADLLGAHDNGFISGDTETDFNVGSGLTRNTGSCSPSGLRTPITRAGPADHGAAFLFKFQDVTTATPLAPGASKVFSMFYGAAPDLVAARNVLGVLGAEAYSFGYPNNGGCATATGAPNTYIWAFAGINGTVIVEDPTCSGADCASKTVCSRASAASVSTTISNCASLNFDIAEC